MNEKQQNSISETTESNIISESKLIPNKIEILKRNVTVNDSSKLLFPIRPYHVRWAEYIAKRNEIFDVSSLSIKFIKKSKRSTIRMRKFFKMKKECSKYILSSIINDPQDQRYYAQISFLNITEYGLLDSGANVSCIGSQLALSDFSKFNEFREFKALIKTADGNKQKVFGYLEVNVQFKNQVQKLKLLIVPSLSQNLILGLDFWKKFNLAPDIFQSVFVYCSSDNDKKLNVLSDLSAFKKSDTSSDFSRKSESNDSISKQLSLTHYQQQQLEAVKSLFPNFETQGLGRTCLIKHEIDIGNAKPIKQRFYPVSPAVEQLMYGEIDRMLDLGVIEPSHSSWSSPMRLVIKPNKVRLCLDARKLNSVTQTDAYPLPSIEGIFSRLPKANIISKLDLKDAFWQIGLDDESKHLTAFTVPGRPLYQFVVMPFGLCNAPQTMCRLMDELIPADLKHCVFGYLDDLIIVSDSFPAHLTVLVRIAEEFRRANLTLNIAKSQFCVTEAKYLGYIIGYGGLKTDPDKIVSILSWPVPKNLKQVRGFLGLCGWYRRFIENFSSIVFPITEVLSTKKKFIWTTEASDAFKKIQHLLTTAPVLMNPDFTKKFYVHCDASDFVIVQFLCNWTIMVLNGPLHSCRRN